MKKYINGAPGAPDAVGPYSQAVIFDHTVYLSGQIPVNPDSGEIVEGGIEQQAEQVLKNLLAVLGHMGLDFSHIIKTTIYLTDMKDFQKVNATYSKWMGAYRPARGTVQVAALPLGANIEIEAIAGFEHPDEMLLPPGVDDPYDDVSEHGYSAKDKGN